MADTIRAKSAMLTLAPVGVAGGVSAQDFRDLVVSSFPNIRKYQTVTAITTLDSDADLVYLTGTGTYTVTLPAAATMENQQITFKKTGASGTVTIDADGSETIDASTTYAMNTQWQKVTLHCNGSAWFILSA